MKLSIFFILMIMLCFLDLKTRRLPNLIILPAIIVSVVVLRMWVPALMMFCSMALLYDKKIWAGGDVKLATMIAALLGWPAFWIVGATLVSIYWFKKVTHYHYPIPVAPFMLGASTVCIIAENLIKYCA